MSSSMIATVYFIALVVFFLLLVVLTIAWIVSKSRKYEEDDIGEDEAEEMEESIFDEADSQIDSEQYGYAEDSAFAEGSAFAEDSAFVEDSAFADHNVSDNMEISDETYVNTFDDDEIANVPTEESVQSDVHDEEETNIGDKNTDVDVSEDYTNMPELQKEIADENEIDSEPVAEPEPKSESESEPESESESEPEPEPEPITASDIDKSDTASFPAEELIDSAFAPEPEGTGLTNEAIDESVREAMAMGAAVSGIGVGLSAASMFGVREELERGNKKNRQRSVVPSTDDFFWFNRMDVAEKPSYKTAEMYYHYFDTAKDCIDDLLIEMYDCALVRTEEIRYIAYGIEPRAISMKEILSSGNYTSQQKLKEPTTQDLVRIYEKWCGYVDKLFDKVEIHADAYTIDEIRRLLCEFGRSDVDVLLEGK